MNTISKRIAEATNKITLDSISSKIGTGRIKIFIDHSGNEFWIDPIKETETTLRVYRKGINCNVWKKGARIILVKFNHQLKPLK